jgi:hypothetical protein
MTKSLCAVILALMLTAGGAAQAPPVDATTLVVSLPASGAEIDAGKMKGDLTRMAWSADGRTFYFQTVERDTRGNVIVHRFVLAPDDKQPKGVDQEPPWAAAYWSAKSAQTAPGMAGLKITIDQQQKRMTATASPVGGDMAKGGVGGGTGGASGGSGGSTTGDAVTAANQSQMATVVTLKLKAEVVGEFVNAPALAGTTFGWGPSGTGLIAFVNGAGRLVIMDGQGRKQEVEGSKAVLLPGWSTDGTRLAYLERSGRKKYTVKTLDISIPRS